MQHILTHITDERLPDLHAALNRALNTWEDKPQWLVELCDALDAGLVVCRHPANQLRAAAATLEKLGYTYHGGELWKPPLGKPPHWALQPYQLAVMAMVDATNPSVPEDDLPLPEWAERQVAPDWLAYLQLHAQLCTRDGRKMGNAVVVEVKILYGRLLTPAGYRITVLTDMGREIVLNRNEVMELFYPPRFIVKKEAVGKRMNASVKD